MWPLDAGWRPLSAPVSVQGTVNSAEGSVGWSVELAVPWSILRQATNRPVPPAPGDQWRINFSRVQWNVSWDEQQQAYVKVLVRPASKGLHPTASSLAEDCVEPAAHRCL